MRKANITRTGERLIRLAYDLEALSVRLHEAGEGDAARGVHACSSQLGNIGRRLDERRRQNREQV